MAPHLSNINSKRKTGLKYIPTRKEIDFPMLCLNEITTKLKGLGKR